MLRRQNGPAASSVKAPASVPDAGQNRVSLHSAQPVCKKQCCIARLKQETKLQDDTLDRIDIRLLGFLQQHGRASNLELAQGNTEPSINSIRSKR
jgi:hypothetical protein